MGAYIRYDQAWTGDINSLKKFAKQWKIFIY